jgi:hypothetical protein
MILTGTLAPRAMAAYPGENGVILYFCPDPEPQVDAAYLGFVTPEGATAPSNWVRSWDSRESAVAFSPDGLRVASEFAVPPRTPSRWPPPRDAGSTRSRTRAATIQRPQLVAGRQLARVLP